MKSEAHLPPDYAKVRSVLPGFQPPPAVKEDARLFAYRNQPFTVCFLKAVPKDAPLRSFSFYLSLDAGEQDIRLLAYSFTGNLIVRLDNDLGSTDYWVRIFPDALALQPAVYTLRVMEHGVEIFKAIINVMNRPEPECAWLDETVFDRIRCRQQEIYPMNPNSPLLGPPVSGTYYTNNLWIDGAFGLWRCTTGGTPGIWIQQAAAIVSVAPTGPNTIPLNYLIVIPSQEWAQFRWDGAVWQPVFLQPIP